MYTEKRNKGLLFLGNTDNTEENINETAKVAAEMARFLASDPDFKASLASDESQMVMGDPVLLVAAAAAAIHTCYHEEVTETTLEKIGYKAAFRVARMLKFGDKSESQMLARSVSDMIEKHEMARTEAALDRLVAKHC